MTILEVGAVSPFYEEHHKERDRDQVRPETRVTLNRTINLSAWPLLLHGGTGSGKSCIGLCMFDVYGGWYVELSELLALILRVRDGVYWFNSVNGRKAYEKDIWDWWESCSLTVLDELGVREKASDFAYETVKKCLDKREGKPTVFISNLSPFKLATLYDDRIASRLCCGTVIQVTGDRRLKKEASSVT